MLLQMMGAERSPEVGLTEEDQLRAQHYRFLSRLLAAPADEELLDACRRLLGDESDLGRALSSLAEAARNAGASSVADEYQELFIGIGRGELMPFASFYLTGFLNERPLAKLRGDMARLGIARNADVHEPEDHIAALSEMMAGLITGAFGAPADLARQRQIFRRHIEPWAGRFFADLEAAKSARFYRPVGTLGRHFIAIEQTAFGMIAEDAAADPED